MLQTMQPFFMRSRFSLTTTFLLPDQREKDKVQCFIKLQVEKGPDIEYLGTESVKLGLYNTTFNYFSSPHVA